MFLSNMLAKDVVEDPPFDSLLHHCTYMHITQRAVDVVAITSIIRLVISFTSSSFIISRLFPATLGKFNLYCNIGNGIFLPSCFCGQFHLGVVMATLLFIKEYTRPLP